MLVSTLRIGHSLISRLSLFSVSLSISLCLSLSPSLALSVSLSLSLSFSLSLSLSLSVCLSLSLSLTGYNVDYSPPYLVIRNSWGTGWGQGGYMQLEYGVNACGVAEYPASSVV